MAKLKQKDLKQYFTPPEVALFMVKNSPLKNGASAIDPAMGEGIFLETLNREKGFHLVGWDIDQDIIDDNKAGFRGLNHIHIACSNALEPEPAGIRSGLFDLVIGNPPFSSQKQKIDDELLLRNFQLQRKRQSIEILFLEKFIQLARIGGLIRIILPINIFANTNLQYVRDFIMEHLQIEAIVSLPRNIFPNTSAKTAILFGKKIKPRLLNFFSSAAEEKIRLFRIAEKKDLASLCSLSIYSDGGAIIKKACEINRRMDPDYYFADNILNKYLETKRVKFLRLGELAAIHNGFAKYGPEKIKIYRKTAPGGNGYVRLIRAKNLNALGFNYKIHDYFIRKDEDVFRPQAMTVMDDVLFVRVGAGCAGRALCVLSETHHGQVDDWIFILRGKKIDPAFLAFYCNSSIGKKFLDKEKQGTGTVSISKGKLRNILVPIISIGRQRFFRKMMIKMYRAFENEEPEKAKTIFHQMDQKLNQIILGNSFENIKDNKTQLNFKGA